MGMSGKQVRIQGWPSGFVGIRGSPVDHCASQERGIRTAHLSEMICEPGSCCSIHAAQTAPDTRNLE